MNASYTEIILAGCILLLPFLYESSHVFRYYLKFSLYYIFVMTCAIILIPVFVFKPKDVTNLLTGSKFCHHVSTLLGLRWILRGKEHLAKKNSFIIVSNHQSSLDVLGLFDIWHIMGKCTVIAKKELLYVWPFGLAAWLCGLIFIPRVNTEKAREIMNNAAKEIKEKKIKMWVFPEGTRRNTGQIHPFKKGAFHLAISSKLPIVPVVFSQYYFLDNPNKRFDHGKVYVTVLPPIPTDNITINQIDELIEKTRSQMTETFHQANKELKEALRDPMSSQGNNKKD